MMRQCAPAVKVSACILCWGFLIVSTDVELSCAVISGGVGGVMTLIIVSQSVIILILLLRQKKATNSQMRFA